MAWSGVDGSWRYCVTALV
uniref:Uncharacterized protein n=1 Tax=Arundo donax TaxID=35708 RepID=A0A0A8ZFD3_ARUDO